MRHNTKALMGIIILSLALSLGGCSVYNRFLERSSVNFITYTDETIERIRVGYGETIDVWAIEREGYTFGGWFISPDFAVEFDSSEPIIEDVTLHAKWIPNAYDITFVVDGSSQTVEMTYGEPLDLSGITKTGHALDGLFLDASLETPLEPYEVPSRDVVLYTSWTRLAYTIEFILPDGTRLADETNLYESPINPDPIERTGYAFIGWFIDPECTLPFDLERMPAENLVLYGLYDPLPFIIEFETGGGSAMAPVTIDFGEPVNVGEPDYPGYVFLGWFLDQDFDQPMNHDTMPAEDLRLFARYRPTTYSLTIHPDNGDPAIILDYGFETAIEPLVTPEKTGFTFTGWYIDESMTEPFTYVLMPDYDIEVFAKWSRNDYVITFVTDPHPPLSDLTFPYEAPITLDDLSFEGYTFIGWFTDSDRVNAFDHETMPAHNLTLYAGFTINTYTITYQPDNGQADVLMSHTFQSEIDVIPDPSRTGFTFQGWFTDTALTEPFDHATMPAYDFNLYASWTRNSYTVSFVTSPYPQISPETLLYEAIPDPPVLVLTGHTFTGWFTDPDLTAPYTPEPMPARDLVLYAGFEVNTYTLSVQPNNGSASETLFFDYASPILLPETPEKTGHTFLGWFVDSELTIPFDLDSMPAEDIDIYASWSVNSYVLTYVTDVAEAIAPLSIEYREPIPTPELSVHGYQFIGWFEDDGLTIPFNHPSMPAYDLAAYASFVANVHTLTVQVPQTFVTTATGSGFTLMLSTDGRVYGSGKNNTGQLGDGTDDTRFVPVETTSLFGLMPGEGVADIVAGWSHAYAITSEGRVFSWGSNFYGQLGTGTGSSSLTPVEITAQFALLQDETVTEIGSGLYHGIALTSLGRVFTWGINYQNELGDGTTVPKAVPTDITSGFTLDPGDPIIEVTAGSYHNIARSQHGLLFAWGLNNHGQLGNSQTQNQAYPIRIDTYLDLLTGEHPVGIAAGNTHTLVLTDNRRLFTFGGNLYGQLGIGTTTNQMIPRDILPLVSLHANEQITSVVAGHDNSGFLTDQGRLFVFGNNHNNQIGMSDHDVLSPLELTTEFPMTLGETVHSMSFGPSHAFYTSSHERLFAMGDNENGQLASLGTDDLHRPVIHFEYATFEVAFGSDIFDFIPSKTGFIIGSLFVDVTLTQSLESSLMPDEDIVVYVLYDIEN